MYEIRPEAVKTFITDRSILLPRFQRKQTWDEKKNFQLCISVFKGYPMGVVILNQENIGRGKPGRFLLDGRQRRNALTLMYENPDEIGRWAKKFLGFKNNIDKYDLQELFYSKIEEYLEADEELEQTSDAGSEDEEVEELEDGAEDVIEGKEGIDLLLQIVTLSYKTGIHSTGFSAPFDFNKTISSLPYVDADSKVTYKLNGKKLKTFIDEYQTYCEQNFFDLSDTTFSDYLLTRGKLIKTEANLRTEIKSKWQDINERIEVINKLDAIMTNSKIGVIEVQGFGAADSQKIFNIINSEGVKLTAVEILSAKSYWNKKINNPSAEMVDATNELYRSMNIKTDNSVYRWDIPATLLSRIGNNVVFRSLSWDSVNKKAEFEKKLTLGFKIFSGIYEKGIKKEDIDKMGKDTLINWDNSEEVISDIKNLLKLINGIPYFQFLKTWQTTIMDITSDAIALDFLLISYFDWSRKGKPIGSGTKTVQFQKNCFILLDQLIYEYVNRQWRGSSDSIIANNIKQLNSLPDMFIPIDTQKWCSLLTEIHDNSTINGADVSVTMMKPLLYHMYCMKGLKPTSEDEAKSVDVDHIIPQTIFKSSTISNKEVVQDNLYNLALLPKKDNISKSGQKLKSIDNQWLISQIEKYEFIEQSKFNKYSDINNYMELFDERKIVFDEAFTSIRNNILNN